MKQTTMILLTAASLVFNAAAQEIDFPELKGPYLGQRPPGMTPEVFAPDIISTGANEGCCCFSEDGRLFLFARAGSSLDGILMMRRIGGIWSAPRLAPFSAGGYDWDFMLAPGSRTVYVSSSRPLRKGSPRERDCRIWISQKTDEGWSKSRLLPHPVNTGQHDSYPSVAADGTLYFFSNREGGTGEGDIYRSRRENGTYPKVENLGLPVNTKFHEVDPFIAPDESYLIFCSEKPGGFGNVDIYVTFRENDGSWGTPVNMGDKINTPASEYIPSITPDGKYFFFTTNTSGDRDIYWMDAQIIERFRLQDRSIRIP